MPYRHTRRRLKPRFFIIIGTFVAIIVTLIIVLTRPKPTTIARSTAAFSVDTRAVVIRDEVCYSAETEYGRVAFHADEGEDVVPGAPVACVYRWGYTDDILQRLYDIESDILTAQTDYLHGIETPELTALNTQISDLLAEAAAFARHDPAARPLLDIEVELTAAMVERNALLDDIITPAPEEIVLLINRQTAALETVADWSGEIIAAEPGRLSFRFDDLELAVNASKLDSITPNLIRDITKNRGYSTICGTKTNIYKIVDSNHWYIAFLTETAVPARLAEGEQYTVTFTGYESAPLTGRAIAARVSGSYCINILEFTTDIGDFLSIRSPLASVTATFSGLAVPDSALKVENGAPQVTLENGAKVPVTVLASSNGTSIIRPADGTVLTEGMVVVG